MIIAQGRYATVYEWDEGTVLKLFKEGLPHHLAKMEYIALHALRDSGVRVPEAFGIVSEKGRSGLVLERIEGPSMQERLDARRHPRTDEVTRSAQTLAIIHASLHEHSVPRLPSQRRMLEDDINSAKALDCGTRDDVIALLSELPDGDAACHGDLHPRNVMMSPGGPVIVDCLSACEGNPIADVARSLMVMEAGQGWDVPRVRKLRRHYRSTYLHKYCFQRRIWPEEVHRWRVPIAAARLGEGFPREREWLLHIIQEGLM